jgi:hypothetical protein
VSTSPSHPEAADGRNRIAVFGGNVLWRMVGVASGAIAYVAEAGGFELEMRRAASRMQGIRAKKKVRGRNTL